MCCPGAGSSARQEPATGLPATVPGTVHTDLLANGKIKDPFYRTNERDLQWIDKKDWEYQTTLDIDADTLAHDHVELCFLGPRYLCRRHSQRRADPAGGQYVPQLDGRHQGAR